MSAHTDLLVNIFSHGMLVALCSGRGVAVSNPGWMVCNSCWFTRGFCSGQSVAYQCQSATTTKASAADMGNETRQPQWTMVHAIATGVDRKSTRLNSSH